MQRVSIPLQAQTPQIVLPKERRHVILFLEEGGPARDMRSSNPRRRDILSRRKKNMFLEHMLGILARLKDIHRTEHKHHGEQQTFNICEKSLPWREYLTVAKMFF